MSELTLYMLVALVGEVLLLLVGFLLVSYFRNLAQRRRDAEAAKALVAKIKQGKAEREQTIAQFLGQQAGLSGEALEKAKVAMLRAELGFLQRVAGVYRKRESAALARIDGDLFAAIEPYHGLTMAGDGAAVAADGEPADSSELDFLRKENKRLSDELTITMETMSRMLNEYSTMFAGADSGGAVPIGAAAGVAAGAGDVAVEEGDLLIASDSGETAAEEMVSSASEPVANRDSEMPQPVGQENEVPEQDIFDGIEVSTDGDDVEIDEAGIRIAGADAEDLSAPSPDMETDTGVNTMMAPESLFDGASADPQSTDAAVVDLDSMPLATAADDPVAEILRQAQTQEASARGRLEAAEAGGDETEVLVEAGPVEVVAGDDGDVEAVDIGDIDDLFDATDTDDALGSRSNSSAG